MAALMSVDDVIREELAAEVAIREVLLDLQTRTGRQVEWVKVEVKNDMHVTVITISK